MAAPIKSGASLYFLLYIFCLSYNNVLAWVQEELDLFDLVDEIKENFYDILKVQQSASAVEIKKAYRRLSMQLHPDRNKEQNAEEQFRKLVQVYDVLKEPHKRLRYDEILRNGLPDWRQPVFYYRRMRKMALWEMLIFLLLLLTSGQYLVMWSIYWEKKFELEELLTSKKKRTEKKMRKQKLLVEDSSTQEMFHEEFSAIPRPQLINLLICRLITFFFKTAKNSPQYLMQLRELMKKPPPIVEDEESEEEKVKRLKKKVKQVQEYHEYPISDDVAPISSVINGSLMHSEKLSTKESPDKKGHEWSDEDLSLLAKAMTKFPGGIPQRWEKIAALLGRSLSEVTQMAKRMKTSSYDVGSIVSKDEKNAENFQLIGTNFNEESTVKHHRSSKNIKTAERTLMIRQQEFPATSKENSTSQGDNWSRGQQKCLEQALSQYPKDTPDRWDVIAEHVPDKSKEECIMRYKELVKLIKQKKQAAS